MVTVSYVMCMKCIQGACRIKSGFERLSIFSVFCHFDLLWILGVLFNLLSNERLFMINGSILN